MSRSDVHEECCCNLPSHRFLFTKNHSVKQTTNLLRLFLASFILIIESGLQKVLKSTHPLSYGKKKSWPRWLREGNGVGVYPAYVHLYHSNICNYLLVLIALEGLLGGRGWAHTKKDLSQTDQVAQKSDIVWPWLKKRTSRARLHDSSWNPFWRSWTGTVYISLYLHLVSCEKFTRSVSSCELSNDCCWN
jgi:hypothetical protein